LRQRTGREIAVKNGVKTLAFGARAKLDPIDHRADQVRGLRSVGSHKNRLELFDLAPVKLRQVRVGENRQFCLGRLADIDVQFALGGLVGYNFGPISTRIKLTRDVYQTNYFGYETRLWANIIFPLWNPPTAAAVASKY
jgi:hypothetical protein